MNKDLEFYNKNGYLLLKDFFLRDEIDLILKEAKSVFIRQFKGKQYISDNISNELDEKLFNQLLFKLFNDDFECLSNSGKQIQHLISLHSLSLSEKVIKLIKKVGLKTPILSTRPVLFFNHPKLSTQRIYHTVDAHQDWRSMQGSLNSVVLWIPLINIDKNIGALEILPGSHLNGLRAKDLENGFGFVELKGEEKNHLQTIEVNVGDALIFSSFLIHQSGKNISNSPRWSCHFRYNDLDEKTFLQRKFPHPYIYKPIENLITSDFPNREDIIDTFK